MHRRAQLSSAYSQTRYIIELGAAVSVGLQPGHACPDLDAWLLAHELESLYLITACNPRSQLCSEAQNQVAMQRLSEALQQRNWRCWPARNEALANDWPVEPSLAVVDCPLPAVLQLAEQFGQYAILEHPRGQSSQLRFTDLAP